MVNFFGKISSYNASTTSGLDCRGYTGALTDGRYIYFVPSRYPGTPVTNYAHGIALRYNPNGSFKAHSSWTAFNAGNIDGLDSKGYRGGCFDGRYLYFAPEINSGGDSGVVLRYDTKRDFQDPDSWRAFDAGMTGGMKTKLYSGACFDGRYIYFASIASTNNAAAGHFLRYDTTLPFKEAASWSAFDGHAVEGYITSGYCDVVFDGRYIYYIPNYNNLHHGLVLRYDPQKPFTASTSWTVYNLKTLHSDLVVFGPAAIDSKYIYMTTVESPTHVVRFDYHKPFKEASSWSWYELPEATDEHYFGCALNGGYLIYPFADYSLMGFDTSKLTNIDYWTMHDCTRTDGYYCGGYNCAVGYGQYFYLASSSSGLILRVRPQPCIGQVAPDPTGLRDLTKFDLDDKNFQLSVTPTRVQSIKMIDYYSLCYYDYGIGAFDRLLINFDFQIQSWELVTEDYECARDHGLVSISSTHSAVDWWTPDYDIMPVIWIDHYYDGAKWVNDFYVGKHDPSYEPEPNGYLIIVGTTYYCQLYRAPYSTNVSLRVYSNPARTSLLATIPITVPAATKWRYLYAMRCGRDYYDDGATCLYYVENVNVIYH